MDFKRVNTSAAWNSFCSIRKNLLALHFISIKKTLIAYILIMIQQAFLQQMSFICYSMKTTVTINNNNGSVVF